MKKLLFLLFILPVFCFAQSPVIPAFKRNIPADSLLGFSIPGVTGNHWLPDTAWVRKHAGGGSSGLAILNQTTFQSGANFNIGGTGRILHGAIFGDSASTAAYGLRINRLIGGNIVKAILGHTTFMGGGAEMTTIGGGGIAHAIAVPTTVPYPVFSPDSAVNWYEVWTDHKLTHSIGDSTFAVIAKNGSDSTAVSVAASGLDVNSTDGSTGSTSLNADNTSVQMNAFNNSGNSAEIVVTNNGGGLDAEASLGVSTASAAFKGISSFTGQAAITVRDDSTHVGLIGRNKSGASQVFPLNGDPAQYLQAGKVDSLITAAGGGTTIYTGDGIIAGDRNVNLSTHELSFVGATGSAGFFDGGSQQIYTDPTTHYEAFLDVTYTGNAIELGINQALTNAPNSQTLSIDTVNGTFYQDTRFRRGIDLTGTHFSAYRDSTLIPKKYAIFIADSVATAIGITALTGDVTASGTGSVAATLATVNSNVGSFGDATHVPAITVNGKGLTTAVTSIAITFPVTTTNTVPISNKTFLPANIFQTPAGTTGTDSVAVKIGSTGKFGSISPAYYLSSATASSTYQTLANLETTLTNSTTLYPSGSAVQTYVTGLGYITASSTNSLTNKTLASSTDVLGGVTMTLGSDATGDLYYRNSSGILTRVPVGTGTQLLGVSGGVPAYVAAPTGAISSVSNSDGTLTVSPTTGAVVVSLALGHANTWSSTQTFPTPVFTGLPTGTGVASAATASTLAARDANANITGNNVIENYTTTATAAGTTTLTVSSSNQQYFTGSTTQTVILPVTSTLVLGQQYEVVNNSTGIVTVQSSGANTVQVMGGSSSAFFTCILTTGTTAASWSVIYLGAATTTQAGFLTTGAQSIQGTKTFSQNVISSSSFLGSNFSTPSGNTATLLAFNNGFSSSGNVVQIQQSNTNSSGNVNLFAITSTINQTSAGGTVGLFQNWINTAAGSGEQAFADWQIGGSSKYLVTTTGATTQQGNLTLATAGNEIKVAEGTNGTVGQVALVSGTKAITITGITTSSRAFVTLVSPTGTSLTTSYQAVCTSNTLTLQANVAAGTINIADGSTLNYWVIN